MLRGNSVLPETEEGDPEEQFQLLNLLGQGAFGSVSKALHKKTGVLYAIKILSASSLGEMATVKKEIQILRMCDNEHIVKYFGCYFKDNNLWIILEYCHAGSVIDLLNITQRQLTQQEIASILQSVLMGLDYLHQHRKIHRDIKAANILLNKEGMAKLADFGVSAESMYTNAGHRSQVGSPYWMSPEVMRHSEYTNKTDIWSLGVTTIELAEGVVPNSNLKPLIAMWQLKDKPVQSFKEPTRWSAEFNAFVKDCLNVNPNQRPEAKQLLNHPFIVNNSRGQSLLAELVQRSLQQIQEFQNGQQKSQGSQMDLMQMLNRSDGGGVKTIVNKTQRSRESQPEEMQNIEGSMIINQVNGSMIVNEQDSSMVEIQGREAPVSFLNRYIDDMKSCEDQKQLQKETVKQKVQAYDQACLNQLQQTFSKHKAIVAKLLQEDETSPLFGVDKQFITTQIPSKINSSDNLKQFLQKFSQYQHSKEFQRSDMPKKNLACHHSTQTNDPSSGDLLQLARQFQYRGVKSQQFTDKEFRTTEKHCFNSKSIISDMENVKYSKDFHNDDSRGKLVRRFIVTEPYDWGSDPRPTIPPEDKARLRHQFFDDPDVKESILSHIQAVGKEQFRYDRIVAQSTLYHDWGEESVGMKHQNSITMTKGNSQQRNHFSEQQHLLPHEQFEEEDTEVHVNLFNHKGSIKLSKTHDLKSKKSKKRQGMSAEKRGKPTYASGAGLRRINLK